MDPLTVLGIVANIVQLGDASLRAADACYQVYKHGATVEVSRLTETASQLDKCYEQLETSLNPTSQYLQNEKAISELGTRCRQTAQTLQKELAECTKSAGGGRREAVTKFITTQRKAKKIDKIKKSLEDDQRTLNSVIQADLSQRIRSMDLAQRSQSVDSRKQLNDLLARVDTCQTAASRTIRTLLNDVASQNAHEHTITRSQIQDIPRHIDDTFGSLTLLHAEQEISREDKQFRDSFRFDEINHRKNDIEESYPKTFGWIFDETSQSQFSTWLRKGDNLFWINGKPGSGKSTLMKFIIDDLRTTDGLQVWAAPEHCVKVSFFFWLSGDKLQRNMRGFYSSFLFQLLGDVRLLREIRQSNTIPFDHKIRASDWSVPELGRTLGTAIRVLLKKHKLCIFMDGMDEFDRSEISDLFDYVHDLSTDDRIKICISSRPESYLEGRLAEAQCIRLQDLTRSDIAKCIEGALKKACRREPRTLINDRELDDFIRMMIKKADGVFLWVHYALRSVQRGIENEDDFQILRKRLEELPSGLQELYLEMWKRHNGDDSYYQEEAREYFSYHEYLPMTVFEMMVACNANLTEKHLRSLQRIGSTKVIDLCLSLQKRIQTRCAGLLHLKPKRQRFSQRRNSDGGGSWHIWESFVFSDRDELNFLEDEVLYFGGCRFDEREQIESFATTTISFIHRTARDFLVNTEAGQAITGGALLSREESALKVTQARIIAILQGLRALDNKSLSIVLNSLAACESHARDQLLEKLKEVCEAVSRKETHTPNFSIFQKRKFALSCLEYGYEFDYIIPAMLDHPRLLSSYLDSKGKSLSSYYLGDIFSRLFIAWPIQLETIQLAKQLISLNADLYTDQFHSGWIFKPIEVFLGILLGHLHGVFNAYDEHTRELVFSELRTFFDHGSGWELEFDRARFVDVSIISRDTSVMVFPRRFLGQICGNDINQHILKVIDDYDGDHVSQNDTPPTSCPNHWLKILGFESSTPCKSYTITPFFQTMPQDAKRLGLALEKTFKNNVQNATDDWPHREFMDVLREIQPRCQLFDLQMWRESRGFYARRKIDAKFLDSSVKVDETNWWSHGWQLQTPPPIRGQPRDVQTRSRSQQLIRSRSYSNLKEYDVLDDSISTYSMSSDSD